MKFVPFATVTTLFLANTIVNAEEITPSDATWITNTDNKGMWQTIFDNLMSFFGQKEGVITSLLTHADPKTDNLQYVANHLSEYVTKGANWIFSKIYEYLSVLILETPSFLFNNDWFSHIIQSFSALSIILVSVLTLYKISMDLIKNKKTDIKPIMTKFSLAFSASLFSPLLLKQCVHFANFISGSLIHITSKFFTLGTNYHGVLFPQLFSVFDICLAAVFTGIYIFVSIPVFMQVGRRWADLLMLGSVTPLALSAWCFDEHKHFHSKWWASLKNNLLSQVMYSLFIGVIGLIFFSTPVPHDLFGALAKILVSIGCLWRLASPPKLVTDNIDTGDTTGESIDKIKKSLLTKANYTKSALSKGMNAIKFARKLIFKV